MMSDDADALPQDAATEMEENLHLWDYVQVVLIRLPLAISVFLSVIFVVALYTWTRVPRYSATARVLIERGAVDFTAIRGVYDPLSPGSTQRDFIQTQSQLITSRPILQRVLEETGMIAEPPFAQSREPIRTLQRMIGVNPLRNSNLIEVSVISENPRRAAVLANAVVDAFLRQSRMRRSGIAEEGSHELRRKADELRMTLDDATRQLHEFMVDNKMVSFEDAQNIVVQRLHGLSDNLTRMEPIRMRAESRLRAAEQAIERGLSAESIPDVLESPIIRQLKIEISNLEQKKSEMQFRLGEGHTQLRGLTIQIDNLRTQMAIEISQILAKLRLEYEQALNQERLVREGLERQEEEVMRFNELASQYNILRSSRDSIQSTYQSIVSRIEELDINRMSGQGDYAFIDYQAEPPRDASWPSKKMNMMVAIFFGGLLAVGTCFFLDYMDITIKGETDIRRLPGGNILGAVPSVDIESENVTNPDFLALEKRHSHFAEAFRSARTALAFSISGKPLRSLVVSSSMPSEGKSICAINLAIAHAQTGKRTLLVDADMRKPRLHKTFECDSENGLTNLLVADELRPDDVQAHVVNTKIDNLDLLPCGPVPPNPVELLDSKRFHEFLAQCLTHYELVLFDSPPSGSLVDSLVIGKAVDGLIMVVRTFVTPKAILEHTLQQLINARVRIPGIMMNNADMPQGTYYNYYYYGRYGRYGYYQHYYHSQADTESTAGKRRRWFSKPSRSSGQPRA